MRRILATTLLLTLVACDTPQSTLNSGGPAAERLSELGWFVYAVFFAVTAVMWMLVSWLALRRRGNLLDHEPIESSGGESWIVVGGFAVPIIIMGVIFVRGLDVMSSFPLHDGALPAPEIRVTGHQWWWQLDYIAGPVSRHFETANEIHIPTGRMIDIDLVSADVIHSFWIPELHGKVDLVPGRTNHIRLRADQPGTYSGQCAEFCGAQHAHMRLLLVAESQADYEQWLFRQRESASSPSSTAAAQGEAVMLTKSCPLCHTVRGTPARGNVGPDLTHLAGRRRIAANMLELNTANLAAWVTHAQSLKPESHMPNLTQFDGGELRALVAYLQQLE